MDTKIDVNATLEAKDQKPFQPSTLREQQNARRRIAATVLFVVDCLWAVALPSLARASFGIWWTEPVASPLPAPYDVMVFELSVIVPFVTALLITIIFATSYALVKLMDIYPSHVILPVLCVINIAPTFGLFSLGLYAFVCFCYGYTLRGSIRTLKEHMEKVERDEEEDAFEETRD
ncbi:hypothetical protein H9P43_006374 [Blastocladiella emersonii ATCC 22665]|nr:hypothetical protein H9P43_006374 [Blastocladiella emersonii ATCC 22665]